jgi:hypothetical protein
VIGKSEIKFTYLIENEQLNDHISVKPELQNSKIKYTNLPMDFISYNSSLFNTTAAYKTIFYDYYDLTLRNETNGHVLFSYSKIFLQTCSRYTVLVFNRNKTLPHFDFILITDIEPSNIHMIWQVPQIVLVAIAELIMVINGQAFAYHQAPVSMKSVLQSLWYFYIGLGDLFVIAVDQFRFTSSAVVEYLIFALLLTIATVIFILSTLIYDEKKGDEDSIIPITTRRHVGAQLTLSDKGQNYINMAFDNDINNNNNNNNNNNQYEDDNDEDIFNQIGNRKNNLNP